MFGKFSQSQIKPVALGATVNSSTYSATIPVYYGRTAGGLLVIWQANIREDPGNSKKGQQLYLMNIDFLIGQNPILTPLQFWVNQGQKLPLNFLKTSSPTRISPPYPFDGSNAIYEVPDPNFYAILAVTITQNTGHCNSGIPCVVDDYGNPNGPYVPPGVTWEYPLWNAAYHGPDPTIPTTLRQVGSYPLRHQSDPNSTRYVSRWLRLAKRANRRK